RVGCSVMADGRRIRYSVSLITYPNERVVAAQPTSHISCSRLLKTTQAQRMATGVPAGHRLRQ
ncbi:MAG: hypothetical protein WBP72_01205, partial [Rhodocyclaceae bacterium]